MILAIDIGNIRTTIALFAEEGTLSFQSELETDSKNWETMRRYTVRQISSL